jgi:hypothetical protein
MKPIQFTLGSAAVVAISTLSIAVSVMVGCSLGGADNGTSEDRMTEGCDYGYASGPGGFGYFASSSGDSGK